ncbi:MAG: HlyD family efflux transporter periplasmic adaptor subunit, partial [Anaerolineales bacterium]|nr:HlyD family efflux transporter periplasmic adaptor subunit [Anaerolineales bacterium]
GSESGGRVVEVLVTEGQVVQAGEVLFRLDDELLRLQRDLVAASGQAAMASARLQLLTAWQALDQLYEDAPLQAAQAEVELANARDVLDDAERRRSYQQKGRRATDETIEGVEAQLELAKEAVRKANNALNRVEDKPTSDPQRAAAEAALYEARQARNALQTNLNWYAGKPTDIDQAILDAAVSAAGARLAKADVEWNKWKTGPDRDVLALRRAALAQGRAQLEMAETQAESDLASIDLQLDKLQVCASVDGIVVARSVEPGEVLTPGAAAIAIRQQEALTITVFVPEDRYGEIAVGDLASVEVDTFPGVVFEAEVTRIADQAEFTPRNVQTEEGRRITVFAVELTVKDAEGRLKPGMPADVRFES